MTQKILTGAAMNSFMRSIFPREKNLFDTLSEEVLNEGSDNARKQQAYDKQFTQNIRRHALEYLGEVYLPNQCLVLLVLQAALVAVYPFLYLTVECRDSVKIR